MINRLEQINATTHNSPLLMGHIVGGYPNFSASYQAALGICKGGATFLEVQFPFSDPNADGPTIENASYQALNAGFTVNDGFNLVQKLVTNSNTAIIIMTYANIIFKVGVASFVKRAFEAGATAFIVPDLPLGSDEGLREECARYTMGVINIAAPGSSAERIREISDNSFGLLYTVARRGITGTKTSITDETLEWIHFVKQHSSKPIALGFGIQSYEQVASLSREVPIVVAGSYFVNIISQNATSPNLEEILTKATSLLMTGKVHIREQE